PRTAAARAYLLQRLFIEPNVLVAVAVIGTVAHDRHVLDEGFPARAAAGVEQDRPRHILLDLLVDLPHRLLAIAGRIVFANPCCSNACSCAATRSRNSRRTTDRDRRCRCR